MAIFLLACVGIMIPTAAGSMRVCLLAEKLLVPGFGTCGESASGEDDCCPDCGPPEEGESCCHDVKKLPDVPVPAGPLVLPPLLFCELARPLVLPPCPVVEIEVTFAISTPIRGPDSPGARRALLGIWNI